MKVHETGMGFIMTLVLLMNDHLFKHLYPGWITGKLSDLAGPFVLYRLLRGIPPMGLTPGASFGITLTFAMGIKISQPLADWVSGAACGVIFPSCGFIADPWDIVAYLPFVLRFIWEQREARIRMPSPSAGFPGISPDR